MATKEHGTTDPGCPVCNPGAPAVADAVCRCMENAYADGLRRWHDACPCCFSDAHPEGVEAAVEAALK
jgi:hypothetical protein